MKSDYESKCCCRQYILIHLPDRVLDDLKLIRKYKMQTYNNSQEQICLFYKGIKFLKIGKIFYLIEFE